MTPIIIIGIITVIILLLIIIERDRETNKRIDNLAVNIAKELLRQDDFIKHHDIFISKLYKKPTAISAAKVKPAIKAKVRPKRGKNVT